ncbi:uncharacterized protein pen-2 isoform X1 [Procambarus clarkii]|uniref:uncharacterized protein pen-2 isoform X1 n=1 Tax=Procambarus clarkii TaxID=6728 RepID=UPI00374216A1
MSLAKMPNERKLTLCRKYYMAGFALLPFMWAINAMWFFKEAFWTPPYPEQKQIRKSSAGKPNHLGWTVEQQSHFMQVGVQSSTIQVVGHHSLTPFPSQILILIPSKCYRAVMA